MLKGIDISVWQGSVDWSKVKDQVDFVIIRAGYGKLASQKDDRFEEYYAGCKKYGIPVGAYWASYAVSASEAKEEAAAFLECAKGKSFEYPILFDYESFPSVAAEQNKPDVARAVIDSFCEELIKNNYCVGLYSYYSMLKNVIPEDLQEKYDVALAHYADSTPYTGHKIWQYSSKGKIDGINGDVDLDYCYVDDYPEKIKTYGLNGFGDKKTEASTTIKKNVSYPITVDTTEYDQVSYPAGSNLQISEHFNVREFACKCGKSHNTLINTRLVAGLERLYRKFNCSMIIVNSGYRCPSYDTYIGGFVGKHATGDAADVVFYDQNKQVISTKKISCAAQDMPEIFGGIANITSTYTAIHLDVRKGYRWLGNEVVSNNTVTDDFYKYYGLTRDDVYPKAKEETPKVPDANTTNPVTPKEEPKKEEPTTKPVTEETKTPELKAGAEMYLSEVMLYASSTAKIGKKKSGTFYLYDDVVLNNRVKITNSPSNVGKTPVGSYVTGWIDLPKSFSTPKKEEEKKEEPKIVPETIIKPGMELNLSRVDLFSSANATRYSSKKTGTFYAYDGNITNGRIRITNKKENVGKTPIGTYVTGWINVNDIK